MPDTHAATDLKIYIDNDGDLYRQQTTSILKNLVTKRARGQYRHDLAVKAFGYLVEAGAKKYVREFGDDQPWNRLFDAGTRKLVAEDLTGDFEVEAALGNYDQLLPKKYQDQGKAKASAHATKKRPQWKTPTTLKVMWSPVNQAYLALWPGEGRIENQQILKVADANEMHEWLRDTYGEGYGLAGRPAVGHSPRAGKSAGKKSPAQLRREIAEVLGSRRYS